MDWFDCHDPVGALIAVCDDPNASHSITVGIVENQIVFTDPDQSVLVVGPPQGLGKTSGVLAPALISHRGPAIAISTKADLATISALMFFDILNRPATTELSAWYASEFVLYAIVLIGLAFFGFYTSTAEQKLWQGKLLGDED